MFGDPPKPKKKLVKRSGTARTEEDVTISPTSFVVPEILDDYKKIVPGSSMWMRYWRDHPEEQDAMIEWHMRQVDKDDNSSGH
jgi:hypothetical protein